MFDIGFTELLLIAILGLVVIGPKRLPEVVRTISLWIGRIRRSFSGLKQEMEREFKLDDVRLQLYNEEVMNRLKESRQQAEQFASDTKTEINNQLSDSAADTPAPDQAEPSDNTTTDSSVTDQPTQASDPAPDASPDQQPDHTPDETSDKQCAIPILPTAPSNP